jgi:hypothetical protein
MGFWLKLSGHQVGSTWKTLGDLIAVILKDLMDFSIFFSH